MAARLVVVEVPDSELEPDSVVWELRPDSKNWEVRPVENDSDCSVRIRKAIRNPVREAVRPPTRHDCQDMSHERSGTNRSKFLQDRLTFLMSPSRRFHHRRYGIVGLCVQSECFGLHPQMMHGLSKNQGIDLYVIEAPTLEFSSNLVNKGRECNKGNQKCANVSENGNQPWNHKRL